MGGLFGSAPSVQTVQATPEPAPAPSVEEATLEEFSDEEVETKKRKTKTQGTKALQIPLGVPTDTTTSSIGTV